MPIDAPLYPVNLVVAGRRCLVVGGGRVAARKVAGLVACGARVSVVAPEVGDEMRREVGAGGVSVEERPYRRGEVSAYRLAVAATSDPAVNRAVFEDGEAAGVWVNAADDPANCSVVLPAVVRRGPVVVAVSTGGYSPALASWLRDRVAALVGPEHAELAGLLHEARAELASAGVSTEGLDWHGLLGVGELAALVADGNGEGARARILAWAQAQAGPRLA